MGCYDIIDHIRFRSCCHYLNDQSHQRNDIGPRSIFHIKSREDVNNFERIASLHPYSIHYSFHNPLIDLSSMNVIWKRITSLYELNWTSQADISRILITQQYLPSFSTSSRNFNSNIQFCTNLLEITLRLRLLDYYKYLPSSLITLNLLIGKDIEWSFDDDTIIAMMNRVPDLIELTLTFEADAPPQFGKAGALSSISRWSSLTKLSIDTHVAISFDGLIHNGSFSLDL
jgi:hypothetical protein